MPDMKTYGSIGKYMKTQYFIIFLWIFMTFSDSRHAQLSIYAVVHEESDFQVKNEEIRRPEAKR